MRKDWVVWLVCVCLFLAGGVYFQLLPEITWKREIGVGDVVSTVSALAAAFAAYAAWQSATISKEAASQSRTHSRLQIYIMHREQFYVALDQIEKDQMVEFYKRNELYNDLFPSNRFIEQDFKSCVSYEHIRSWSDSYLKLSKAADLLPLDGDRSSDRALAQWAMDYTVLTRNYLKYRAVENDTPQFYIDREISTGLCIEYANSYLWRVHNIINSLYVFGSVEDSVAYSTPTENLRSALGIMKTRVVMGQNTHDFKV